MVFTSFVNLVSLQMNPCATRQNPQNNVSHVLIATSSSTTSWSPFSAGEGYSLNQNFNSIVKIHKKSIEKFANGKKNY